MYLRCGNVKKENATWEDIEAVLPRLKTEAFFTLIVEPSPKSGPDELEIQAENGNYMPLMTRVKGPSSNYDDPDDNSGEMVGIGGYEYLAAVTTQDYDRIVKIAWEFYHNGEVSPELWRPYKSSPA